MVVDETLVYTNNPQDHLEFEPETFPIICQLGGCTPEFCGKAVELVEQYGYMEVNLNVDCPSNRVSGRQFGAILMKYQETCINMVRTMQEHAREIAVSVKTRIGIDDDDEYEFLVDFIQSLTPYCKTFYIHARKCLLNGLSPAQNRIVPPLNYARVYQLCRRFPECDFYINGGIAGLQQAKLLVTGSNEKEEHVGAPCSACKASNGSCVAPPCDPAPPNLRGVMLGRAAMENPSLFWDVDRYFYQEPCNPCRNRRQVLDEYCDFLEQLYPRRCCDHDERVTTKIPAPNVVHEYEYCDICQTEYNVENTNVNVTRPTTTTRPAMISSRVIDRSLKPVLGMFFGLPKSKTFRRTCDELSRDLVIRNCGPSFILKTAMRVVPDSVLDQDFVKTQDLKEGDVVSHIAPGSCC